LALALNAISKFMKNEYRHLNHKYQKETSEQCIRLFSNFGESKEFTKQSLMMNIISMGRF